MALTFPPGFLWGAATAAHQVEGNNRNTDWWASEEAGRVPHRSGLACDQWHRYPEDIALLSSMGLNAYRFSVEWARIEPEPGRFDAGVLDHYRREIEALRAAGIEPVVTLHHFTNPRWVARAGGWTRPATVHRFAAYVERVAQALGDLVTWWVTINEPNVVANFGYLEGTWPPHRARDLSGYLRSLRLSIDAHALARQALQAKHGGALASMAFALYPLEPFDATSPADRLATRLHDWLRQGLLLHGAAPHLDWVGVNYYFRQRVRANPRPWERFATTSMGPGPKTDFGWEIYPPGLYQVLMRVARLRKPILVTENGLADAADGQRSAFLDAHLREAHRALQDGVDLRGYLHWSLLDNFEWSEGYTKRFGLVAVDFQTQRRTPRPSAAWYRDVVLANALP